MFRNWTKKDFTYPWSGTPYTFEVGKEYDLGDFAKADRAAIANHFAKHLAVRELHAKGLQANDPKLEEYVAKATGISETAVEAVETEKPPMGSEITKKK